MIPQGLNFMFRRFGTLCSIFIGNVSRKEGTVSETSAHKIQRPGNHPKEIIQHSEHGENLKSKIVVTTIQVRVNVSVFAFRIIKIAAMCRCAGVPVCLQHTDGHVLTLFGL